MTENDVFVQGLTAENAKMLLQAARDNDMDESVVRTTGDDGFYISQELADIVFPPKKKKSKDDPVPPVKEG